MRHSLVVLVTVCLCAYMWKDLPNELHRGVPMVLDAYSRGLLVRYATSHPDATEMVPPSFTGPTVQVPVELVMNVTVTVPESVDPLDTYAATLYAGILPFPDSAADCGAWNLNDRVPPQYRSSSPTCCGPHFILIAPWCPATTSIRTVRSAT